MAKSAQRRASWKRPGSPIGRKGPRKAPARYTRNKYNRWSTSDVRTLRDIKVQLDGAKTEEDAVEAIGSLRELLIDEDLIVA